MNRLTNKTVIVPSAASGIGRGIAERFSHEGANVVACDKDDAALRKFVANLPEARTLGHVVDVSDYAQVQAIVTAAVARFGRLDVLVNKAGVAPAGNVEDVSIDDWQRALNASRARLPSTTAGAAYAPPPEAEPCGARGFESALDRAAYK